MNAKRIIELCEQTMRRQESPAAGEELIKLVKTVVTSALIQYIKEEEENNTKFLIESFEKKNEG